MTQTDAEIVALGRYVVYGPGMSGDTDDMNEVRKWLANDASGQARLYVQVNPQDDLVHVVAAAMCPPEASYCRERMIEEGDAAQITSAVVAALTEAGRLREGIQYDWWGEGDTDRTVKWIVSPQMLRYFVSCCDHDPRGLPSTAEIRAELVALLESQPSPAEPTP